MTNYFRDFCKWWLSELHALLPKRLRRGFLWRRDRLVGVLERTEFVLLQIAGNRERQLLRISGYVAQPCGDLNEAWRQIKRNQHGVTLRLGRELGLLKLLRLPLAARNDLDQMLRFEMDRLSPFGADDVYFAYRVVRVNAKVGEMLVEVQIVPRRMVQRALATAERLGLRTRRVELAEAAADGRLNLLPRQAIESSPMGWLDRALAALALTFAAVTIVIPLQKQHATAADLERQAVAERNEAEESLTLRQELDNLTFTLNFVFDRKKSTIMLTRVLAELTRLIPDDAYVVQLHINEGEVRMQGYAESVSDLISALEGSPLFWRAEFLSPIATDPQNGRKRFQIAVAIRTKER